MAGTFKKMKLSTTNHYKIKFCLYGLFFLATLRVSHSSYIINNHESGVFHMSFEKSDLKKLLSQKNSL